MAQKEYIAPELETSIESEIVKMLQEIYKPGTDVQRCELYSTNDLIDKVNAIVPASELSVSSLISELKKAGFAYKALKGEQDFNFYWIFEEI